MARTSYVREAFVNYKRLEPAWEDRAVLGVRVCTSDAARHVAQAWFGAGTVERFAVFGVDARNRVVVASTIGQGSETACCVSLPELARVLLLSGASGFIVSHNHPSGDPVPSPEDIALTKRIATLASTLGFRFLDHVIVTDDQFSGFSFLDNGMMPQE